MKPSNARPVDPAMAAALRARLVGGNVLPFDLFMEVALYEPGIGYYRTDRPRVGYGEGTDFLTATASSPLFGRLVAEAAASLLGPADLGATTFVEVGAEAGRCVLDGHPHPFGAVRKVGVGEVPELSGPTVLFSNELFDAQPFRRFRFREGAWRELGVRVLSDALDEAEVPTGRDVPPFLPKPSHEGAVLDLPFAATELARTLLEGSWTGLFLAFDYGKRWEELLAAPEGTARAYFRHAQSNDLLANVGHQDLTCHVCWDWIMKELSDAGFTKPTLDSQEGFFVRHAGQFLARYAEEQAGRHSAEKRSILELIHPEHLGRKFQVLWAARSGS